MIPIKSKEEIKKMQEGGKIAAAVLEEVLKAAVPGVMTHQLDSLAERLILEKGGYPSLKDVAGWWHAACININEGVVHGIPSQYVLKEGEIISVDLGVRFKGFHTDLAWTKEVQNAKLPGLARGSPRAGKTQSSIGRGKFLRVGKDALSKAIEQCRVGKRASPDMPDASRGGRVGDISQAIQTTIEGAGYNVVRRYVGHGVGRSLHESPQIPCFGKAGTGERLKAGMVLAIEVIYTLGSWEVELQPDGWTAVTKDGKIAGLFEKTVAVTPAGPLVITDFND